MKVFGTVLTSALLVAGCAQVIDQVYSKKDFNTQSFRPIFRNVKNEVRRSLRCA